MADFATVADLTARWRSLSDEESSLALTLLADASAVIRNRFPDIDTRVSDGDLSADMPMIVAVNMVKRVLLNPSGVKQETTGPYSATFQFEVMAGYLVLSKNDEAMLAASPAAASTPAKSIRVRAGLASPAFEYDQGDRYDTEWDRIEAEVAG